MEMRGPSVGDNRPPDDVDPLTARLAEEYGGLIADADTLTFAADVEYDEPVKGEDAAGQYTDFIGNIHTKIKLAEKYRVGEKEPFLRAGRTVDAWFKQVTGPLDKASKVVSAHLRSYQVEKANAERKAREEVAKREREAAEQAAAEAARLAAAAKTDAELDTAIETEEAAREAAQEAARREKEAQAKAAELSRTRGQRAQASLTTFWDFSELDRGAIDLEKLRSHIPLDALEKAVRSYIKAGGRELHGCKIFENYRTQVR